MEKLADLVSKLEKILVTEFHICVALQTLTKEEREALLQNEVASLARVVERKEATLDELGQLDDQRRMVMYEVAESLGLTSVSPTITEISTVLQNESGERLNRLREGIVALNADIRHLSSGNASLALNALESADAAQTFLRTTYHPCSLDIK